MSKIFEKIRKKLKGRSNVKPPRDIARYEAEREIAKSSDVKGRITLAKNSDTHQEILYYLAENDEDPAVREAVARNISTPVQASPILAGDHHEDVRIALAERLVKMLPDLNAERHSQLYAFAVQALGTLALDEVLKIRIALSSALKDHICAPPEVVNDLARDIEQQVAEPILKFCSGVSDKVLMEILQEHPATWAVSAIAGRKTVSQMISQAVIDTWDKEGGKTLIRNKGADISKATLDQIIERARDYPEWQSHLAMRANLPPNMAKKLAQFADRSVRKILLDHQELDAKTAEQIADIFKRRMEFVGSDGDDGKTAQERVEQLFKDDHLDEIVISDALGMRDFEFVIHALAKRAGTDYETAAKLKTLKSAKAVVALCWKAKLPMRFALKLQQDFAQIPPRKLVYPRDGTHYPLTLDEMIWQLELIGVEES